MFRSLGKAAKRTGGELSSSENGTAKMAMIQTRTSLLLLILLALSVVGCGKPKPDTPSRPFADVTGQQVLEKMTAAYSSAQSYSDQAVLYLTYRLNGRPVQEPHPWAVSLDRQRNEFGAQFYDTQLGFEGQSLGFRIYDIETENFDNQFLVLTDEQPPIDRLLSDEIARRYMGGGSELPLSESPNPLVNSVVPPTLDLLLGQAGFPWIRSAESVERLEDQTVEGVVCFHIRTQFRGAACDLWVEQETGLLHQLLLPNSILLSSLSHSSAVADLKLVARFHDCQINGATDTARHHVSPPEGASLVTEFVKLPDQFPSELVGKQAPDFAFRSADGRPVNSQQFKGKPSAFLWIAGYDAEDGIRKLNALQKQLGDQVNLAVVYSEAEMKDPSGNSFELTDSLTQFVAKEAVQVPFYCDHQLDVGSRLRIKALPSVLVMDKSLRIQFAKPLSMENWAEELGRAIVRVSSGEDLAQEMIADYGRFYSQYRAKLNEVRADSRTHVKAQNASVALPENRGRRELWSVGSLLRPGGVSAAQIGTQTQIAVLDGYRTAVVLDPAGQQIASQELPLPPNQGVTRIRIADRNGKRVLAAFSKLDSQVHWFDDKFQRIGSFPKVADPATRITDCRFQQTAEGRVDLVVATEGGLVKVELDSGISTPLSQIQASELAVDGRVVAGIANGRPFVGGLPVQSSSAFAGWHFLRLAVGRQPGKVRYCALGSTDDGHWQAVGLDQDLSIQWKSRVGDQGFAGDVESVVGSPSANIWVVGNADYGFSVLSAAGEVLFLNRVDQGVQGIDVIEDGGQTLVVYSDGQSVTCLGVE